MLRMYSIMQLGNLWTQPPRTTADSYLTDNAIDEEEDDDDDDYDDSIIEVHPVAVETTNIQEQQEERMTTGYQTSNKCDQKLYQYAKYTLAPEENDSTSSTPITTAASSSFSLSASSSDPGLASNFKNNPTVATLMHDEKKEDSIKKNDYYYYYSQPPPSHRSHFNRPILQHLQIHPTYLDDLPPLIHDLPCITEEDQSEINNSSLISSTGSLPRTPTSTVSTPLRQKRPHIKFNERRKNIAKKLKRVFTSKSNTKNKHSL